MTKSDRPFSINLFYPEGLSSGIRIAEIATWSGRCTYFPRGSLVKIKKYEEFSKPGVYILIGTETGSSLQTAYIGEGDPISGRIISHESKKDWWDYCLIITSSNNWLNKTYIQFIESSLIKSASDASRCNLDNKVIPESPSISASDRVNASHFLENAQLCMRPLGVDIFTTPPKNVLLGAGRTNENILFLDSKGLQGMGFESAEGFTVKSGSMCSKTETVGLDAIDRARRADLLRLEVITDNGDNYIFTKDYNFSSPTLAARAILGAPAPGPLRWKNKDGITLREIRESLIKE
jgi:hypothetical protein